MKPALSSSSGGAKRNLAGVGSCHRPTGLPGRRLNRRVNGLTGALRCGRVGGLLAGLLIYTSGCTSNFNNPNAPQTAATTSSFALNIPYQQDKLENGLTVIFHEDHSQPLVVININVNVGSRDERKGRTGFAHLFEHLMFMGTSRVPEKMFDEWMEQEGGWNNAWTSQDRTDYYDVAPSHALPLLLWMEADRLGTLGGEIDLDKLNTQRGVVRNERRQQTENVPYEKARLRLPELLFPEGHPYHHPVIGSHEDLEAASVADVRSFFGEWYVPANMSLVVAGDFDPAVVKPMVSRYFGTLKGPASTQQRSAPAKAKLGSLIRESMEDTVSAPKIVMAWHSPALYEKGDAELDFIAEILASGKGSRLYQRLVYDLQLAQSVGAHQASQSLQSYFAIEILATPEADLATIEKVVDEELTKLVQQPMTERELIRAKNQYEANFIGRMQSLATRASLLNSYYSSHRDPGFAEQDLARYLAVTGPGAQAVARETFDLERRIILHILPRAGQSDGPDSEGPDSEGPDSAPASDAVPASRKAAP